jgi:hypothetical protein
MPNEAAPRSSEYWHDRAEEARAASEAMHDPLAAGTMLQVAQMYDLLAKRASEHERRLA